MTGEELAEAMLAAAALVRRMSRIAGLELEVLPGVTLKVRSRDAERQRRRRDAHGDVTPKPPPNDPNKSVTKPVTLTGSAEPPLPHAPSPRVLPLENTDKSEDRTEDARAGGSASGSGQRHANVRVGVTSNVTVDFTDSESATVCPLDLFERAEALEVLEQLAKSTGKPLESIRDGAHEFVSYWTIGGGHGQPHSRWMRKLREHLRRAAREGRLKPPGQLEHERHGGRHESAAAGQAGGFDGLAEARRINAKLAAEGGLKPKAGAA